MNGSEIKRQKFEETNMNSTEIKRESQDEFEFHWAQSFQNLNKNSTKEFNISHFTLALPAIAITKWGRKAFRTVDFFT